MRAAHGCHSWWRRHLGQRHLGQLFFEDRKGATAVEYAIMLGAIAAVIIVTVTALGTAVAAQFQEFLTLWLTL